MRPRRRLPVGLIAPIALLLLVGALATLQYRWVGQISEAERAQLGESVSVYLDGGPSGDPVASTIVDLTSTEPRVLREGAVPLAELREVLGREVPVAG